MKSIEQEEMQKGKLEIDDEKYLLFIDKVLNNSIDSGVYYIKENYTVVKTFWVKGVEQAIGKKMSLYQESGNLIWEHISIDMYGTKKTLTSIINRSLVRKIDDSTKKKTIQLIKAYIQNRTKNKLEELLPDVTLIPNKDNTSYDKYRVNHTHLPKDGETRKERLSNRG